MFGSKHRWSNRSQHVYNTSTKQRGKCFGQQDAICVAVTSRMEYYKRLLLPKALRKHKRAYSSPAFICLVVWETNSNNMADMSTCQCNRQCTFQKPHLTRNKTVVIVKPIETTDNIFKTVKAQEILSVLQWRKTTEWEISISTFSLIIKFATVSQRERSIRWVWPLALLTNEEKSMDFLGI